MAPHQAQVFPAAPGGGGLSPPVGGVGMGPGYDPAGVRRHVVEPHVEHLRARLHQDPAVPSNPALMAMRATGASGRSVRMTSTRR
jgi:hypothetical protein